MSSCFSFYLHFLFSCAVFFDCWMLAFSHAVKPDVKFVYICFLSVCVCACVGIYIIIYIYIVRVSRIVKTHGLIEWQCLRLRFCSGLQMVAFLVLLSGISLMTWFLVILCTFESCFACPLITFICKYTSCFKNAHLFLYTFFSPIFVTHLLCCAITIRSPSAPHLSITDDIIYIYTYIHVAAPYSISFVQWWFYSVLINLISRSKQSRLHNLLLAERLIKEQHARSVLRSLNP